MVAKFVVWFTIIYFQIRACLTLRLASHQSTRGRAPFTTNESNQQTRRTLFTYITIPIFISFPNISNALTPKEASEKYDNYAKDYNRLDGGQTSTALGIDMARMRLCGKAQGKVLEIGAGTGLNLDKYDPTQIKSLTLVDISDGMLDQARSRGKSLDLLQDVDINYVKLDATSELIPFFGSETFDTVVDSFSLCVMGNTGARKCIEQISQVVKVGGKVLLLENTRSSNPLLGIYQDVTADAAASMGGKGCVYNQDVETMIHENGRLLIVQQVPYTAGLFRSFECTRIKDT